MGLGEGQSQCVIGLDVSCAISGGDGGKGERSRGGHGYCHASIHVLHQ